MQYEAFKYLILEKLQDHFQSSKQITIQEIIKNNGCKYDGLVILDEGLNIAPTLYLQYYYELYQDGTSFKEVFEELLGNYEANRPTTSIDVTFFTDFEQVKERIVFQLVNYDKNQELLKQIPHIPYLNLAIIFKCMVYSDMTGNASILIHNQHMERWNINTAQLLELAKQNTPKLLPCTLRSLESLLGSSTLLTIPGQYPMYILTNELKLHGASCILYPNLLKELSKHTDSSFYILPSSIHEVLLLPACDKDSIQELSCLVKEVNCTQVSDTEILSDNAYYYDKDIDDISM